MRVYGVTGRKNAGKTTLIERLVTEITARGFTVSTVKHAHHDADIDQPGRDSHRHREAGAQEVEALDAEEIPEGQKGARFLTDIKDLDSVSKALKAAGWTITASEIRYLAKSSTDLDAEAKKEVTDFLNAIDDHDDVHRVYAAIK